MAGQELKRAINQEVFPVPGGPTKLTTYSMKSSGDEGDDGGLTAERGLLMTLGLEMLVRDYDTKTGNCGGAEICPT